MEKSKLMQARVYVGTYKKYNSSSLYGNWMNLADYQSKEEFMDACKDLHSDEDEPEFMYQDYSNIPDGMINESYIDPRIFGIIQSAKDMDDTETEAFFVFLDMYFLDYSYSIHADYIIPLDYDLNFKELYCESINEIDFEIMDENHYNNTIMANSCDSADFEELYGDKNAKVLVVVLKNYEQ